MLEDGVLEDFHFTRQFTDVVTDPRHGVGQRTVVIGRAANEVEKEVAVTFFERHPGLAVLQSTYRNGASQPLAVRGWRNAAHELEARPEGFWSFSGATHTDRRDWVRPVDDEFEQRNTLSMDSSDYGGGTPDVYKRQGGCGNHR